ncbi:MAG: FG-GAP-like repeat-containing protein [Bryobacteraceae bacterium]
MRSVVSFLPAAGRAIVCLAPILAYGQYTCGTPGIAITPFINGVTGTFPNITFTGMKRVADGSWTAAQIDVSSPYNFVTTTPNFQNLVSACAPPGLGNTGSGKVVGAVPPAVASDFIGLGNLDGTGNLSVAVINPYASRTGVTIYIGDSTFMPVSVATFQTGYLPTGLAIADLNHDGKPDIVVADLQVGQTADNGDIAVLLNNGGGSFANPVKYMPGSGPISVAVGDVNGDGIPDIVTANNNDGTVSVLIGIGNGTFKTAVPYQVGGYPQGVVLADFNGDGKLDIAVGVTGGQTSPTGYGVSVLLNQGNGVFGTALTSPAPETPFFLAAYDFDSDGKMDLAVNDGFGAEVAILHGLGNGMFTWAHTYATVQNPSSLIVTDFNNDGIADIVVGAGNNGYLGPDNGSNDMSVLLGNGDGTFRGTALYPSGKGTNSVAIADFNNDGKADIVAGNQSGTQFVDLLTGNGDGTFAPAVNVPQFGSAVSFVTAADFNGDGNQDIAATTADGSVLVALGNGKGGFAPTTSTSVIGSPGYMAVGDFNGDGIPDAIVAGNFGFSNVGAVSVLIGNGDGTFKTPTIPLNNVNALTVATGDFNLDGNLDAAVVVGGLIGLQTPGSLVILKGKGDGTFTAQTPLNVGTTPTSPISVTVGDVNGDGKPDLVVAYQDFIANFGIQVFLGKGDGTFQPLTPMTTEFGAQSIVINDFTGDGRPDLVISHCCGATNMTYMIGNGDGTFQTETEFSSGPSPWGLAMGELNGDGVQDLVVADELEQGSAYAAVLPGTGLRTQSAASFAFLPLAPDSIVACFGSGVGTGTSGAGPSNVLLGTTVNVQDSAGTSRPATLLYVSPHQVNYVVPDGTASGLATVTVTNGNGTSLTTKYYVSPASPGIFALNSGGLIAANVIRVHSGVTTMENIYTVTNGKVLANPLNLGVSSGDTVSLQILGTGFRSVSQSNLHVTIGGVNTPITSSGAQGSPGLDQLTVQVPTSLAGRGKVTVVVIAGSQVANLTNFVIQ